MNIRFEKVRWKNLLSYGNVFTEIDLSKNTTTLLSGSNGAGKSTLLEAIVFALFGKPYRKINKPQLVNSINKKDMLVELEFTIHEKHYMIRRGMLPNIFEVFEDGILVDQNARTDDYQTFLEKNILRMKLKTFTQIVILGSAMYVPFMELPLGGRREIIEDLLDIQVFTRMLNIAKNRTSELKTNLTNLEHTIDMLKLKKKSAEEKTILLEDMRDQNIAKIEKAILDEKEKIEKLENSLNDLKYTEKKLIEKTKNRSKISSQLKELELIKRDFINNLKETDKDLKFYDNHDDCPTCKQIIDAKFKSEILSSKKEKKKNLQSNSEKLLKKLSALETLNKEMETMAKSLSDIQMKLSNLNTKISQIQERISDLLSEKEKLLSQPEEISNKEELKDLQIKLKEAFEEKDDLIQQRELYSVTNLILKDDGIKTKIIKQYVPTMNHLINKYLEEFDLFVNFEFDEKFSETIKSRHRDKFTYASFSEGEKLRISLAIMLTWRQISKMRNSVSTNLLIMDETLDGSLDGEGIENLINTIHELNSNDNIFVISHRGNELNDKFGEHIRFTKERNFSTKIDFI